MVFKAQEYLILKAQFPTVRPHTAGGGGLPPGRTTFFAVTTSFSFSFFPISLSK